MSEQELDARGLACPLPVLRARKFLRTMKAGQRMRLLATDAGAVRDVDAMCEATGDRLVESSETDGEFVFVIEKQGAT